MDITPSASGRELDFPADASPGTVPSALESLAVAARYKHGEAVYRCNDPVAIALRGVRRVQSCDRPALTPAP
jgi:hypothetical protein